MMLDVAQMYRFRHGLMTTLWGVLITIFDFNVNRIPLLPDPLGFLIAAIGLGSLIDAHRAFGVARALMILMIFISALGLVPWAEMDGGFGGSITLLLAALSFVVQVLLALRIAEGLVDLATRLQNGPLAESIQFRLKLWLFALIIGVASPFLLMTLGRDALVVAIPISIFALCAGLLFYWNLRRVALAIDAAPPAAQV